MGEARSRRCSSVDEVYEQGAEARSRLTGQRTVSLAPGKRDLAA